jgi:hypothetical protein
MKTSILRKGKDPSQSNACHPGLGARKRMGSENLAI